LDRAADPVHAARARADPGSLGRRLERLCGFTQELVAQAQLDRPSEFEQQILFLIG
jgi:hypothetical protein